MKPLSKGDTCRVRLHTGDVVEAVYDEDAGDKEHWVEYFSDSYLAVGRAERMTPGVYGRCRFVGPACVLVPVGVSV